MEKGIAFGFLVLGLVVGALVVSTADVNVEVRPSTVQAEQGLPEGVQKFEDGAYVCYTFNKWEPWGNTSRVGGISCVNH